MSVSTTDPVVLLAPTTYAPQVVDVLLSFLLFSVFIAAMVFVCDVINLRRGPVERRKVPELDL